MLRLRLTILGALLGLAAGAPAPAHAIDPEFQEAMRALNEVRVISFTRSPATIGPWGSSTLSWVVEGRDDLVDLELDGRRVPFRGSLVVAPRSTTGYGLVAIAKGVRRGIGGGTVTVDRSGCQDYRLLNVDNFLENLLRQGIEAPYYLRGGRQPEVTFERGYVRIRLWLGKNVNNAPDPSIDIDARFSLLVDADGDLRTRRTIIGVEASLPWWAEQAPGASQRLREGERQARAIMNDTIRELVSAVDWFYNASRGTQRQDVVIDADGIRVWECPAP
jgi:hypothetical protein